MSQLKIGDLSMPRCKGRVIKNGQYYKNRKSPCSSNKSQSHSALKVKDRQVFDKESKNKIIKFLRGKKEPQKTLAIAKACNHLTSKEINPLLYCMVKQRLIEKCNTTPPMWILSSVSKVIPPEAFSPMKEMSAANDKGMDSTKPVTSSSPSEVAKVTTENAMAELTQSTEESSHIHLFKNTSNDSSAPGAYPGRKIPSQENRRPGNPRKPDSDTKQSSSREIKKEAEVSCPTVVERPVSPCDETDQALVKTENIVDSSVVNDTGAFSSVLEIKSSNESSDESDDDDDDDDDEIQTRIRDMIFTSRVIEEISDNYAGLDQDFYENFSDDGEEYETETWESEKEPDRWQLSLPSSEVENIVDRILSVLISLPMGTVSKSTLMSRLEMSEDLIDLHLSVSQDGGLTSKTENGFIKITQAGKRYHCSKTHSSIAKEGIQTSCEGRQDSSAISVSKDGMHSLFSSNVARERRKIPFGRGFICNSYATSKTTKERQLSDQANKRDTSLGNSVGTVGVGRRGMGRGQWIFNLQNQNSSQRDVEKVSKHLTHLMPWISVHNEIAEAAPNSKDSALMPPPAVNDSTPSVALERESTNSFNSSTLGAKVLPLCSLPLSLPSPSPLSTIPSTQRTTQHKKSLLPLSSSASSLSSSSSSSLSSTTLPSQLKNNNKLPAESPILPTPQDNVGRLAETSAFSDLPHRALTSVQGQDRKPALLETPKIPMLNPATSPYCCAPSAPKKPLLQDPMTVPTQSKRVITNGSQSNLQINSESFAALNKNPISAFMEYAQSRRLAASFQVLNEKSPAHKPVFLVIAYLGNRSFPTVTCHNKKDGRKEAAELAIRTLIAEGEYHAKEDLTVLKLPDCDMTFFDKMAALTHQKFNQLIAQIPESFTGRKVIAGLVIKMGPDDVGSVIAIGSGNRCITGDKLSLEGNTVNDCHAEIITRRGFLRFLYHQLSTYKNGTDHPIFEPSASKKLRVKDCVTFHLYISTAPCGDGALFSPRDEASNTGALPNSDGMHRPLFNTPVQGVLRTKMEGGEGTIPINPADTIQTWDGIVRGERLRTMSCSDKICRWNVLGLQGALLSHLLDTVYLSSLTLGFLYDHGHLSRAVCCRLNRGCTSFEEELPHSYRLNHPRLGRVTACDPPRETQKTKSYSVNWSACEDRPELLDGSLGHCHTGIEKSMFSRLSKSNLYALFKSSCPRLGRPDLLRFSSYYEAKQQSKHFTAAKRILMNQFEKSRCGRWVSKPVEEEMFNTR